MPKHDMNVWISDGEKLVEVDCLCRAQGWTVHRFWDVDINGTPAQVAATILAAIPGHRDSEEFGVRATRPL